MITDYGVRIEKVVNGFVVTSIPSNEEDSETTVVFQEDENDYLKCGEELSFKGEKRDD